MKTESVWDYPRPPAIESCSSHIRVVHKDYILADSNRVLRVLETSHPPVYYLPPDDVRLEFFKANGRESYCEFKGRAEYLDYTGQGGTIKNVAWRYPAPRKGYDQLRDRIAIYPSRVDACYVNDVRVSAQEGDFYGGWITPEIKGPFKGGPGTFGW